MSSKYYMDLIVEIASPNNYGMKKKIAVKELK